MRALIIAACLMAGQANAVTDSAIWSAYDDTDTATHCLPMGELIDDSGTDSAVGAD
jgi:hypothetical protein